MTKDEMLKERDRLASQHRNSIKARPSQASKSFQAGFNAALQLSERERVKPLRETLLEIHAKANMNYVLLREICEAALIQVEE